MGRIQELLDKQKQGTLTAEEQKELDELKTEAKQLEEASPAEGDTPAEGEAEGDAEADAEEEVDKLADQLVDKAQTKLEKGLEKVLKNMQAGQSTVTVKRESKAIYDPAMGKKVAVEELESQKVVLEDRKKQGKKNFEVSRKTLHWIQAMLEKNVEKLQVLVEGTGARGGFLVPDDFANIIVEDRRDDAVMRQLATVLSTRSDTFHLPSLASRPRATFRAEAAVKSTSTVDFAENIFTPYSLAVIVSLSNELVADASMGVNGSIVNYVAGIMATALREREETAFWEGNGTSQPTGVDNYTLRTVAAGAGASDSARADALIAGFIRTPAGYRNRGAWAMNQGTLENVMQLKDANNNYLVSRLPDSPQMTIKGRPIYEVNDLPGGTAFFGDFGYYYIVDREGIQVNVSDEATVAGVSGFERNITHVRVEARVDGELVLPGAITEITGLGTP